ncbi:MAG: FHA domain-containing protein, partial [Deltaproteobacteria bacterium]|nr:FHA domain-containing protein [Deltaproteobacteria bacterium]
MLRITVTKDGESPQVSTFEQREITIGRTTANDLVIGEPGVSSNHARVLTTGDGLTLIDLESTNGTFVNGERIRGPALVQPGDEIYICAYRLDFNLGGSGPQPEAGGAPSNLAPPPIADGPPMVGAGGSFPAPEYPTPAELGPPPLGGAPSNPAGPPTMPPMMGGAPAPDEAPAMGAPPPLMDGPPMMGGPPMMDAPPPVGAPPPVDAPPPLAAPEPMSSPAPAPMAPPPQVAAPEPAPAPAPVPRPQPVGSRRQAWAAGVQAQMAR